MGAWSKMTSVSKEKYKAGKSVQKLLREFEAMELDIDFAAYLLLSAGLTLAMQNNMSNSSEVVRRIGASMFAAQNDREEEEEETCH